MKTDRTIKHKLFYPVGLISLVILPLLFIVNIINNPEYHPKSAVEIYPVNDEYIEHLRRMAKHEDFDVPPEGAYIIFNFTNDESNNFNMLEKLRQAVRKHGAKHDTVYGIRVSMDKKMSCKQFISILDILILENCNRYIIYRSSIWLPRYPRYIHKSDERYASLCGGVGFYTPPPPTWKDRIKESFLIFKEYCKNDISRIPVIAILFLVALLILNITRGIKHFYNGRNIRSKIIFKENQSSNQ